MSRNTLQNPGNCGFSFEGMSAMQLLEELRTQPVPIAVVVDEYGSIKGLVTASDILAAIAGDFSDTVIERWPGRDGSGCMAGTGRPAVNGTGTAAGHRGRVNPRLLYGRRAGSRSARPHPQTRHGVLLAWLDLRGGKLWTDAALPACWSGGRWRTAMTIPVDEVEERHCPFQNSWKRHGSRFQISGDARRALRLPSKVVEVRQLIIPSGASATI